jgi:putative restriction endonuclease
MSIAEAPTNLLPTHLDLPWTDGKPVEKQFQPHESMLLTGALTPHLDRIHRDGRYLTAADMGIYWRWTEKEPLEGCKVPDWFYIPGVPRLLNGILRRSYVLWQEKAHPVIVIEYVSGDGSEERDQTPDTGKFWVYEQRIQSRFYAIHDPDREELSVYELIRGKYQPLLPTAAGRFRIPPMELDLGIWHGEYLSAPAAWLRAWDLNGNLIPTPQEIVEHEQLQVERERNRAEREQSRADQERNRADKLAERLRELGINPDTV